MAHTIIEASSEGVAERALAAAGFSLGRMQRGERRGILFGDWDIQKWRNLSRSDIDQLHGLYQRRFRDGPVILTLRETVPADLVAKLRDALVDEVGRS